jgi:hypothetical protein
VSDGGRSEEEAPRGYDRWEVAVSAVVGVAVTLLLGWWANGFGPFYESLFRVGPTVDGGGVGTDWAAGNTVGSLDALIALTHAADVLLGLFVLLLVFVHWASFRRLADRMRQPGSTEGAMTDGGPRERESGEGGERG